MHKQLAGILFMFFLLTFNTKGLALVNEETRFADRWLQNKAEKRLQKSEELLKPWMKLGRQSVDSIIVQRSNKLTVIYLGSNITHIPIRHDLVLQLTSQFKDNLGWWFRNYRVELRTGNIPISHYIPNAYRNEIIPVDSTRIRLRPVDQPPLITRRSAINPTRGLYGNHIALWHSHGLYFNQQKNRWQWQRARLFGTVEDIFPTQYVLQYIAPMLENAGATVLLPRERDTQTNEVIVDNDHSTGQSELIINHGSGEWQTGLAGYQHADTLFDSDNPFLKGSHLLVATNQGASVSYVPDIPEAGNYGVYFSWAKNEDGVDDALVQVSWAGGSEQMVINQQMGYQTWIYLGNYYFAKGKNAAQGSVTLLTHSQSQGVITTDAVRFGGGMGSVARRPSPEFTPNRLSASDTGSSNAYLSDSASHNPINYKTSEYPRWTEGARYYLQYAGMPDSLTWWLNEGKNDYNDDYMSRGEWVNYLMGDPLGPQSARKHTGLNIPIDLSFAFHTDAGITRTDTVIGTLAIYSAQRDNGIFPDTISRMASRDVTDMIQSQIVDDIRELFNPNWTRRAMWDRQYSESWRPNVPAMLLELLSHQNLADMQHGLDPRFQFHVSRAVYKGILRFQAFQENRDPVIQPLPPSAAAITHTGEKNITITWHPTTDPLEPTAIPTGFVLYTRREGEGFNEGVFVNDTVTTIDLPEWNTIFSFRITAVNEGGESFPSETLSTAINPENNRIVLIVNGFQRIAGPAMFDTDTLAGLTWWDDHAIPYQYSLSATGMQYDYKRNSPWLDDDSPGWGASYANTEGQIIAGNTFDYPFIHGQSIRNAGYSFVSASREAYEEGKYDDVQPFAINLIMGKQKGTPFFNRPDSISFRVFTPELIEKLEKYAATDGNILISGAYIATDSHVYGDSVAIAFAQTIAGYTWRTNNADISGVLKRTSDVFGIFPSTINYQTLPNPDIYYVEAPDAIEPHGPNSTILYQYLSNQTGAAVLHHSGHKAVSMGFPFETIIGCETRDQLMKAIMEFLEE